jgi:aspartate/methionine/tyrosine aminotransferase
MRDLTVAARAAVPPFYVMDVLEAANARQRARGDVVSLAAGQPSAPASAPVLEAAQKALYGNKLGYTEQLGIPELREAIAGHYERMYSLEVSPQDVVVTTGSSGGFLLSFLSAFDVGDRVALARPGYPAYRNILTALGCEVVEIETFQPTVEHLDGLGPLKGVVIASPANPTGTIVAAPELAAIAGWCAEHGVQLISDEIYHGIDYGLKPASAWQFSREPIVVNSFSKYFAMTGWRLGWLLVPQRLHRAVECLIGNFNICAPAIAQHAAVAAFTEDSYRELDGHVEGYRRNRETLLKGLTDLRIDRLAPADGAFYVYADIGHLTHDAMSWCQRLLADTGLAIVPGIDFDPERGSRFVRLSFAGAHAEIEQALTRLKGWV